MTTIGARFQVYGKTAADWVSANPVLLAREIGQETDTGKIKLGDGVTAWNSLGYFNTDDVPEGAALYHTTARARAAVAGAATGLLKSSGSALAAAVAATDYVAPGAATGSGLTMATARLLGRSTAGVGAIEEIAVGDGLALSSGVLASNVIIAQSWVGASVTGTAAETTLATITVPANTMGANGRIEIETLWSYTNSANNKQLRIKFGSLTAQNITATNTNSLRVSCFVANRNNTSAQVAPPNSSTGSGATTNSVQTAAIDTTASVSIAITGQLANTGETITLEGYIVRLYR